MPRLRRESQHDNRPFIIWSKLLCSIYLSHWVWVGEVGVEASERADSFRIPIESSWTCRIILWGQKKHLASCVKHSTSMGCWKPNLRKRHDLTWRRRGRETDKDLWSPSLATWSEILLTNSTGNVRIFYHKILCSHDDRWRLQRWTLTFDTSYFKWVQWWRGLTECGV